jgi:hypothetical protein
VRAGFVGVGGESFVRIEVLVALDGKALKGGRQVPTVLAYIMARGFGS